MNISLIEFLGDIRGIDELEELTLARDTLLYLLQDLGFLII